MTSIVILTRNQLDYTKLCIESIRRYTGAERYEIIVVDNHSTDGTAAWLKAQKDIRAIFNVENRGFAKGCNQGMAIANGSEILLLNNDTVVTEHWLTRLKIALYSDERIGAVGPVTNHCGNFQKIDITYQNIEEMQEFAAGHNCVSNPALWEEKMKLVGFCMLLKKSVVDHIGCLDEAFWRGNFEDDDYSYRMLQAGYQLRLCHDVFIHHFGNVTFKAEVAASEEAFYRQCMDSHAEIFTKKWGFDPRYVAWCREDVIEMMDVKRENLSVLEIGCACGATLLRIKYLNRNARVYGIELAPGPAEIAGHFAEVRTEDIETAVLEYEKGQFDYILFPDVLEHLRDPQAVLRKMKPYLKPGGAVIASVPNVMHIDVVKSLLEGNWTYKDAGILDKTHLRFFTLKEIRNLLREAGYKECACKNVLSNISPENEALIEKISQLALTPDPKEFRVYQYIVKAVAVKEEPMAQCEASIQAGSTMSARGETSLDVLLRNIGREVELEKSVEEALRLRKAGELDVEAVLLPAIENAAENKMRIAVCLATSFYENGFAGDALTLLIPFYENKPQDAQLVYALGTMLRLMGEREAAMKVLLDFQGEDQSIQELLRTVEKEV